MLNPDRKLQVNVRNRILKQLSEQGCCFKDTGDQGNTLYLQETDFTGKDFSKCKCSSTYFCWSYFRTAGQTLEFMLYLRGHRFDPGRVCCVSVLEGRNSELARCTLPWIRTSAQWITYAHSDWYAACNPHAPWGLPSSHLESLKNAVKSNNLCLLSRSVSDGEVTWLEVV